MPKLPPFSKNAPLNGTRKDTATEKPAVQIRKCSCQCGENVAPRSTFRQGHDQRLVGWLAEKVVDGSFTGPEVEWLQLPTEIDDEDIQVRINHLVAAVRQAFSPALAAKVDRASANRWDKVLRNSQPKGQREPKAKKLAAVPNLIEEAERGPEDKNAVELSNPAATLGARVQVKIGRWQYNAEVHGMNQSGKVTAVRYVPRSGSVKSKVATEGQFQIV
jgi:hypothetical protein